MRPFRFGVAIVAVAICGSANAEQVATESDGEVAVSISNDQVANAEMNALFVADQAIRLEVEKRGGWLAVKDDQAFMLRWEAEDADRMKRTRELLESNALKAGVDFYRAAFIFQHGDTPEDYLKAHHLAVLAIVKGYDARWISAATLDRYLQAIGRQQIYGTQFRADENGKYVKQPVETGVVSDAERQLLNVPPLASEW